MSTVARILELSILALALLPGLRVAAHPPLLRLFPKVAVAAALAVVTLAGLVAATVLFAPALLHAWAVLAAVVLTAGFVRARNGFLFGRRLPPGSLSLTASVKAVANRRFYLEQASRHGPVFKTAQFGHKVVCVLGLERGHALLRAHAGSIEPATQPFDGEISGGFLRYMEGDTYRLYGPLFRKAFARPVTEAARPVTVAATRRELEQAALDCARSGGGGVTPGPYLERIVKDAFLKALFGIAPGSADGARLAGPLSALDRQNLGKSLAPATRAALEELHEGLAHITAASTNGSEGPSACALTALQRNDPRMPDATCYDNLLFTYKIAAGNVYGLLHWTLALLGSHGDWRTRVRDELDRPVQADRPGLAERIVLETLRLAQSEYLYKRIGKDIEHEGLILPAGWFIRVCVWESHRDGTAFADPEKFDPDRFLDAFTPAEYSPFGWGKHACNGIPLAMLISKTLVEELAAGYDWSVSHAEPAERGFRHWAHWRPSSEMTLQLSPLPQTDAKPRQVSAVQVLG